MDIFKPIGNLVGGIPLIGRPIQNLLNFAGDVAGAPFEQPVYNAQYPAPWAFGKAQEWANEIDPFLANIDALAGGGTVPLWNISATRPTTAAGYFGKSPVVRGGTRVPATRGVSRNTVTTSPAGYGGRLMELGEGLTSTTAEEDYLNRVKAYIDANSGPKSALWNLTSERYLNALTPRFSAMGTLTSGPGRNAMLEGMENLATTFANAEAERQAANLGLLGGATNQLRTAKESGLTAYNAALEGLKALELLPISVRNELIKAMFAQQGVLPKTGESMLEQVGGGSGLLGAGKFGALL